MTEQDRALEALTFAEFRAANVRRCEQVYHLLTDWSPTDWATALAGEVGEACNLIKKRRRGEDIPLTEIAKEFGDVVAYLDLLSAALGIDLGEAVASKFNEVSARVGSDVTLPLIRARLTAPAQCEHEGIIDELAEGLSWALDSLDLDASLISEYLPGRWAALDHAMLHRAKARARSALTAVANTSALASDASPKQCPCSPVDDACSCAYDCECRVRFGHSHAGDGGEA